MRVYARPRSTGRAGDRHARTGWHPAAQIIGCIVQAVPGMFEPSFRASVDGRGIGFGSLRGAFGASKNTV
jgi:hypothetical protein